MTRSVDNGFAIFVLDVFGVGQSLTKPGDNRIMQSCRKCTVNSVDSVGNRFAIIGWCDCTGIPRRSEVNSVDNRFPLFLNGPTSGLFAMRSYHVTTTIAQQGEIRTLLNIVLLCLSKSVDQKF